MHKRLLVQSPVIANDTPILKVVNDNILLMGEDFTRMWEGCGVVSDL